MFDCTCKTFPNSRFINLLKFKWKIDVAVSINSKNCQYFFFFFESCKQQVPQISLMKERLCKKWIWSLKYLMIHLSWTTILPMAILKIDSIHPLCMINLRVSLHKICENTSFHWPVFSCVRTKSAILSSYGGIRVSETRILVYFMQCLLSNRTKKLLLCQN